MGGRARISEREIRVWRIDKGERTFREDRVDVVKDLVEEGLNLRRGCHGERKAAAREGGRR